MRLAIAAAALAGICGLAACGGDDNGSEVADPDLRRIAYAGAPTRYGQFTVPKQTPEGIGKALAGLDPTWVLGLSRVRAHDTPTSTELDGYRTIRDTVRAKSPDAEFGLELNALEYKTPEDVEDKMCELRDAYDNDGWFFDFFTPAYEKNPDVVNAAISDAHDHGEWIGGTHSAGARTHRIPCCRRRPTTWRSATTTSSSTCRRCGNSPTTSRSSSTRATIRRILAARGASTSTGTRLPSASRT